MKVKINGKWSKHRKPVPSVMHGYRCENVRLNRHDLRELAGLPDKELCARVRQVSARANRKDSGHKGFHSGGFVGTPTGRHAPGPEYMGFGGTRTGRWSSACPDKSQMPRPNKVEVRFLEPPKLADIDFSEIEKRVMARMGTDPDKMGGWSRTAEVQARQEGKQAKLALELWRHVNANIVGFWLHHALSAAARDIRTAIDEEGCGAVFAALEGWDE